MTLDEAIKHAKEIMAENLEKTKGRNSSDPIAINCFECAEEHRQLVEWLEELKQLRERTRWIPVSERLPEDSGEYLVSVIDEYDGDYEAVGVAWFAHKKDYDIKESEWRELGIDETVIAWMPLPHPYKQD